MKAVLFLKSRFALWNAPDWLAARLREAFPDIDFVQVAEAKDLESALADADIFFGWTLRAEQFRAARKLRWIHSTAAAVHQLLIPELVASDVVVTNARDVHGPVVAEHAIALVLALAKCLPSALRYQEQHTWAQEQIWREGPRELAGSTLGLVGFGSIGREVARRALALGMRVLAVREHPDRRSPDDPITRSPDLRVTGPAGLDDTLRDCDFLVLAAPLTEKTRHLIDARRLGLMKPDAFLINVARGQLVDEPALITTLSDGKLAGAALDVFAGEPLPADSPLWQTPRLLVTPHTAAVTERLWERHFSQITGNVRRFRAGLPLLAVVDKRRGY